MSFDEVDKHTGEECLYWLETQMKKDKKQKQWEAQRDYAQFNLINLAFHGKKGTKIPSLQQTYPGLFDEEIRKEKERKANMTREQKEQRFLAQVLAINNKERG